MHFSIHPAMGIQVLSEFSPSSHCNEEHSGACFLGQQARISCSDVSGRGKAMLCGTWMFSVVINVSLFSEVVAMWKSPVYSQPCWHLVLLDILNLGQWCRGNMGFRCGLVMHFLDPYRDWTSLHALVGHPYFIIHNMPVHAFCTFSSWVVVFLLVQLHSF